MTHPLEADLVVAESKGVACFAHRLKMIVLVSPAKVAEGEDALLGLQIIEFEFADLDVQPGAFQDVIKADKYRFHVKCAGVVGGRKDDERNVLRQSAFGEYVQAAPVEAVLRHLPLSGRCAVNRDAVGAHPMPLRRYAKRNRPIRRVLVNGGVAIVHQLVAVVLEHLAKGAQPGPRVMAGRARHVILSGIRWDGMYPSGNDRQSGSGTGAYGNKTQKHCNIYKRIH